MKNGFTLIELLGSIMVLGIILGIATTSYIAVNNKQKKNLYDTKKEAIITAAELYASDNKDTLVFPKAIQVSVLLENDYLDGDKVEGETKKIVNPKDNSSMNNDYICIRNNNIIKAEYGPCN